ncbi:hypothetical protein [Streptomyces sp. SID5643]|uniref:hypothetical protein n=1 Tax=Streptomyces sp. SID5643 TaxID=2690307 RepID=UPI00136AD015|nr:hypothetical protein [Streptomyces sp. SID5643]MZF84364.1 hypothetical protein [Streptomyces sp. SID5643]
MSDHANADEDANFSEHEIDIVAIQGGVSREEAVKLLRANDGDPVSALVALGG